MATQVPRNRQREAVSGHAAAQYTALVTAIDALERAFAQAAARHDARWMASIRHELWAVRDALTEHLFAAEAEHGLLAEMLDAIPRAEYRIRQIRNEHRRLISMAEGLLALVTHTETEDHRAVAGVRQQIGAFLEDVRGHMSQQVELIYEA